MRTTAILLMLAALTPAAAWAQRADVPAPSTRAATVELAGKLSATPAEPAAREAASPKNPFTNQPAVAAVQTEERTETRPAAVSDRRLLEAIAPMINPSGTMMLGGEPILLFGQKRIKVGDTLPISFDGQSYELVISNIQNTSFTLRLRGEELTRPIKPANRS